MQARLQFPSLHPTHYNKHPSGVEPINLTRYMNFNIGNAWEAITRCDESGNKETDLLKAQWYLRDELNEGEPLPRQFSNKAWEMYLKVVAEEKNEQRRFVFNCLYEYQQHGNTEALRRAEQVVTGMVVGVCN